MCREEDASESASGRMLLDDEYGDAEATAPRHGKHAAAASSAPARQPALEGKLSRPLSVLLVLLCAVLIASAGLLARAAEVNGKVLFDPAAACLFSELGKLSIALVWMCVTPAPAEPVSRAQMRYACLAFLPSAVGYVVVNNVRFALVSRVNPGLLQLLWNLKIVFIGLLYSLPPFRRRLTAPQWCGALLLVLGSCGAEFSQWNRSDAAGRSMTGGATGLALVGLTLVVTSAASVSCEFAYKTAQMGSMSRQNLVLYGYGVVMNLAAFLVHAAFRPRQTSGLTANFSGWTWAVVLSQSLAGFAVGAVFKYVDAVAQVFADVAAMLFAALVAYLLFDLKITLEYSAAMTLCALALCVYYLEAAQKVAHERRDAKRGKHAEPAPPAEPYWETRSPLTALPPPRADVHASPPPPEADKHAPAPRNRSAPH